MKSEQLAAARLALSVQQTTDAKAVATANADAAVELAKADAAANAAEAALAAVNAQAGTAASSLTKKIAAQAVQPGQDAADAPVLVETLNALKAAQ